MIFQILELCIVFYNLFTAATALDGAPAKPTNSFQSLQDGAKPPQPTRPPSLTHQALKRDTNVCGIMQNDPVYSDHTYACQSGEYCLWEESWWGCCYTTPVPGCWEYSCPWVTSCIGLQDLSSCDSSCSSDDAILKCTNSQSPFCATATAVELTDNLLHTTYDMNLSMSTTFEHYECATSQYSLSFTVTAEQSEEVPCAPPWITIPASLSK
ncbi:hypothetical protein BDZ45DRAFT_680439 [Acephala macrosclerotiorum]|nr:hypothetical protein BDZ45DRAFT_680439 [Acephala macrosclerotiorum]